MWTDSQRYDNNILGTYIINVMEISYKTPMCYYYNDKYVYNLDRNNMLK